MSFSGEIIGDTRERWDSIWIIGFEKAKQEQGCHWSGKSQGNSRSGKSQGIL